MPKGNNSNTTDKLVIDIKVNVKKGATTQITNLTKSLTKLNEVVKKTANIEKYANALRTIGKELTRTTSNKGISKVQGNANLLETTEVDIGKQKQQTKETEKQEQSIKNITKEKQKQSKLDKDANKENKKSSSFFAKFTRSIGRIALYRAIRTLLSGAMNSIKEGVENLREFDSETDKSFKKIELSATTLKNSLASLFTGIIKGIQPYITSITDAIGNMANRFNEAQASLKGDTKYMKVLTSDTKEWQDQVEKATGNLLEFDKFMALNEKDNTYTGLVNSPVSMSKDEAEEVLEPYTKLKDMILGIAHVVKYLWDEILHPLWNALKPIFPHIKTFITSIIKLIDILMPIIKGVLDLVMPVLDPILMLLEGFVSVLETIVMLFTDWEGAMDRIKNMNFNDWFKSFSQKTFEFITFGLYKAPKTYADGGMVEKGTQFIAGEAGAEVVHTSARGTGVTNIEQFSQAMLQALATYGVARGSDVSFKGDVYIDRTKAGQLLEGSVYGEGVRVGHFKRV